MAVELKQEIKELLDNPNSIKVLATTDNEGNPHVVFKGSIRTGRDGYIAYYELIETSQTNKNMVNSIWFKRQVAINVYGDKKSYQIKGIPYQAIIAGHEFEEAYKQVRERFEDGELSTVWLIEPLEVIEESFSKRKIEEEEKHPILKHLDRLVVNND
jgi:predicted pyridoxine 5'-phosphate oxidase superfamily flavin-nucleotide-binding protein